MAEKLKPREELIEDKMQQTPFRIKVQDDRD